MPAVAPTPTSLAAIWLNRLAIDGRLSAHTLAAYRRDLASFLDHLQTGHDRDQAATLSAAAAQAFLTDAAASGRAPASIARAASTLRGFFRFLVEQGPAVGLISIPAIESLTVPKMIRLPAPALTAPAAQETVATAPWLSDEPWIAKRDAALFALIHGSGLRLGEALGLHRRDAPVAGDPLVITGRQGRVRRVPVLPAAVTGIAAYLAACPFRLPESGPLFVGHRGRPLNPGVVQRQMRRLRSALQLPPGTTLQALRRSFVERLRAEGNDWETVQQLLGHAHPWVARRAYDDAKTS